MLTPESTARLPRLLFTCSGEGPDTFRAVVIDADSFITAIGEGKGSLVLGKKFFENRNTLLVKVSGFTLGEDSANYDFALHLNLSHNEGDIGITVSSPTIVGGDDSPRPFEAEFRVWAPNFDNTDINLRLSGKLDTYKGSGNYGQTMALTNTESSLSRNLQITVEVEGLIQGAADPKELNVSRIELIKIPSAA